MHTISSSSTPTTGQLPSPPRERQSSIVTSDRQTTWQMPELPPQEPQKGLEQMQRELVQTQEIMMKEIDRLNQRLEANDKELRASRLAQQTLLDRVISLESILATSKTLVEKQPLNPLQLSMGASSSSSSQAISSTIAATSSANNPTLAFGKREWERLFGEVGDEPPLPQNIDEILKSPCPFWSGKSVEETHLLTLIPKTVNGQLLTLDTLEELIKNPRSGTCRPAYRYYWGRLKEKYGNRGVENSYWVLMTNDVIEGSKKKGYEEQRLLMETKARGQPFLLNVKAPSLLEATVSILMEQAKSGIRHFNSSPLVYTRCEEIAPVYQVQTVVGGLCTSGLDLSGYIVLGDVGLAASWKL